MAAYIIDTNVCITANNKETGYRVDKRCILRCIEKLRECVDFLKNDTGAIFIDAGIEIINEYKEHLSFSGQPGAGDMFFKELYNNIGRPACKKVEITKEDEWGYAEFPHCQELKSFDKSDRKFVAVAVAADKEPFILNATDSDWKHFGVELENHGIKIEQLCPNCLK